MPSNRRPPSRIAVSRFWRSSSLTLRCRWPLASSSPSVLGTPAGGTGGWLTPAPYVRPVAGAQQVGVVRGNAAPSPRLAARPLPRRAVAPRGPLRRGRGPAGVEQSGRAEAKPGRRGSPGGGDRPGRAGRDADVVHDVVDDVVHHDLQVPGHLERHGRRGAPRSPPGRAG